MPKIKYWQGATPTVCDITHRPFNGVMYDARIPGGGWALMCRETFTELNCSVGIGRGQRYERINGRWQCVAGAQRPSDVVQLSPEDRKQLRDEAEARKGR